MPEIKARAPAINLHSNRPHPDYRSGLLFDCEEEFFDTLTSGRFALDVEDYSMQLFDERFGNGGEKCGICEVFLTHENGSHLV